MYTMQLMGSEGLISGTIPADPARHSKMAAKRHEIIEYDEAGNIMATYVSTPADNGTTNRVGRFKGSFITLCALPLGESSYDQDDFSFSNYALT